MPTLEFKGKQHIYAHHLTVPYRPLESDESKSCNPTDTDDNLIIHGDNLHTLKALLRAMRTVSSASILTHPTTPATKAGATTTT